MKLAEAGTEASSTTQNSIKEALTLNRDDIGTKLSRGTVEVTIPGGGGRTISSRKVGADRRTKELQLLLRQDLKCVERNELSKHSSC